MPSLENLRKQAKLVLRWHRDRYYPVAAQIRSVLPRFRQLSDPEILAHPFKLADAQELVARQEGFESWQALKEGLQAMSDSSAQTTTRPVITAVAAELFVSDIQKSCDFFTRKLGFTVVYVYGEPPFYGQVKRDAARLNLKHMDRPVIDPELARARAAVVCRHGCRHSRRDQATISGVPAGRRRIPADADASALGREEFRGEGPGRQSVAVRTGPGRVKRLRERDDEDRRPMPLRRHHL